MRLPSIGEIITLEGDFDTYKEGDREGFYIFDLDSGDVIGAKLDEEVVFITEEELEENQSLIIVDENFEASLEDLGYLLSDLVG